MTTEGSTVRALARTDDTAVVPLSRNREYNILWISNVLSQLGSQATLFAYPLLVLGLTGSVLQASLVEFAVATTRFVVGLPGGALVDRMSRRRVMLWSEASRAVALALLAVAVALGNTPFALIMAVAVVEGTATALFNAADQALLPEVVPRTQLAAAVARNTARYHVATIVGPGLGGLLYGLLRMLPFATQAVSSLVSLGALLFLRVPKRAGPSAVRPSEGLLKSVGTGLRWMYGHRLVRVTVLLTTGFNLVFSALLLAAIAIAQQAGQSAAETGTIGVLLGVGGVLGALVAPRLRRVLTPYAALTTLSWAAVALVPLLAVVEPGYPFGLVLGSMAFLAPTATAIVSTHQLLSTPAEMRGRLAGAIGVTLSTAAALGPMAGGVLLETVGRVPTVLACAGALLALAIAATVSTSVRSHPRLEELEAAEG
ncbi:MFS transporter [Streptomyces sp. NPDC021093]|uniref:MFS transporter n=1 Tax=Streptomyces sp. NPDC021093 TaxID=3365112 RepID=UPI0037904209